MRKETAKNTAGLLMVGAVIVFFILCCTGVIQPASDPRGATRVLSANGYTSIVITGSRWYGGGEGDVYVTEFQAVAPNGTRVTGVVTRGFLNKGNTIRLD